MFRTMRAAAALLGFLLTAAVGLALAPAAFAQTCEQTGTCEPYEVEHTNTITVTAPPAGTVTGEGISCPGDCTQSYDWSEICTPTPRQDECFGDPPRITLTASRGSGWTADWTGCNGLPDEIDGNQCTLDVSSNRSVSVSWVDVGAPSVAHLSPPAKAGPATVFSATATDNNGISAIEFYVDGVLRGTDTSPPYQFKPNLALYGDGTKPDLTLVAVDPSSNRSATSPVHEFTIDKSTGFSAVSTPAAHATTAPSVSFTPPADLKPGGVTCRTKLGSTVTGTTSSCASAYVPQLGSSPTDGAWTVELTAEDDVGNTATVTRGFTLDRGAPNLTVTGPAAGAFVNAPFTAAWTANDGFTPAGSIDVKCSLDGGAYGPCSSLSAADGARVLAVRARDLAQNETVREVAFTYDSSSPVVTLTGGPADESVVYERATTFTFTTDDLTALQTTCRLDGGEAGACTGAEHHEMTGLGLGIHTFTLRVVDQAGNVTEVQRRFVVSERDGGGGGGTTGGGGGGATTVFDPRITSLFFYKGPKTRFTKLAVTRLPKGAKLLATCKGKGCAFKRKAIANTGAKLNVLKKLKRVRLRSGAVLQLRVTGAEGQLKIATWRIRTGKAPAMRYRCAAKPGAKLKACV